MKKWEIVKKNEDFNDIINKGKCLRGVYFNIYYKDTLTCYPKFGVGVSKKYGTAVKRNKVKRQTRCLIDQYKNLFAKTYNYIIIIKKTAMKVKYVQMEEDFKHILERGIENEEN